MMKALNGRVRWLTRVCQVEWKLAKTSKDWQIAVIIPIYKKGDHKVCTNYREISLFVIRERCTLSALKRNAEK